MVDYLVMWWCVNFPWKFTMQPSMDKVICAILWDRKEMIVLDHLEPEPSIDSDCNIAMLTELKAWTSRGSLEKTTFVLQCDKYQATYWFEDLRTDCQTCLDCPTTPTALSVFGTFQLQLVQANEGWTVWLCWQHSPISSAVIAAV